MLAFLRLYCCIFIYPKTLINGSPSRQIIEKIKLKEKEMLEFLKTVDTLIWGAPLLMLLIGTGIYLTFRLGLIQIFRLPLAFSLIFKKSNNDDGDVSSFASLCTALAATVGTGNIVGVATAIKAGGPGALFWMWMAAFFGMATKYSEGLLAIKYRKTDENGEKSGGPMYYILNGLGEKWRPLAIFFAFSGILVALLGIGTFTQVNSITDAMAGSFGLDVKITGVVLGLLVGIITFGGLKSIAKISTRIVPVMALVYIILTISVIVVNAEHLGDTVALVIKSAFTGSAAMGGFLGATVQAALQNGVARGVFSNESGLGSAPIAAAAAKTDSPVEQGLISMTGTFIDTIIICTMTGLAILMTGVWTGEPEGARMTQSALESVFTGVGAGMLTVCLTLFAFTTILGWNYYGERCVEFLAGVKMIFLYRIIFIAMVFLGAFLKLEMVWIIADIVNGLMAIPNLIALLLLSPIIISESRKYFKNQNNLK